MVISNYFDKNLADLGILKVNCISNNFQMYSIFDPVSHVPDGEIYSDRMIRIFRPVSFICDVHVYGKSRSKIVWGYFSSSFSYKIQ